MRHILIAAPLCFMDVTQAEAHAFLVKSSPSVGSTVKPGISELRLEFSEAVELAFSGMQLVNASGVPVPLGSFGFGDSTHKVLTGKLLNLAPGNYAVKWHVVSVDTHPTEGSFTFRVTS